MLRSSACFALKTCEALAQTQCSTSRLPNTARAVHSYVIPPTRSQSEAEEVFHNFHRRNVLAPTSLLKDESGTLVYVPFWTFFVNGNAHFSASLGTAGSGQSLTGAAGPLTRDYYSSSSQIPATYHVRQDLAAVLKPVMCTTAHASWRLFEGSLTRSAAEQLSTTMSKRRVSVFPVEMHRGIAWELLIRALRAEEEPRVHQQLKQEHSGKHVNSVSMWLRDIQRHSRLVYVPGYLFDYTYGEVQKDSVTAEWQHHQALVPAAGPQGILAEHHYSPHKAQAAVMASVLGGQAAVTTGGTLLTTGSLDLSAAVSIDSSFWAFLAASAAGVVARGFTVYRRDMHASRIEETADMLHAAYMRDGGAQASSEDPHDLRLRADAEWLRWQEGEKWSWVPSKRKDWAERLFTEQATRRALSEQALRRKADQERLKEELAGREAWKRAKYGESKRAKVFAGGKRAGGRFDFKGYYKSLGLSEVDAVGLPAAAVSEVIKQAYRREVMRLHPDRHVGRTAKEQAALQEQFQELQKAYEVLRDEKRRKVYDAGGHVDV